MAEFEIQPQEKLTTEETIERLKEIQTGLKEVLLSLHEKIELLSSEPHFQDGIEGIKRDAETRVSDLESEIKQLRNDLKSIKEILGLDR